MFERVWLITSINSIKMTGGMPSKPGDFLLLLNHNSMSPCPWTILGMHNRTHSCFLILLRPYIGYTVRLRDTCGCVLRFVFNLPCASGSRFSYLSCGGVCLASYSTITEWNFTVFAWHLDSRPSLSGQHVSNQNVSHRCLAFCSILRGRGN